MYLRSSRMSWRSERPRVRGVRRSTCHLSTPCRMGSRIAVNVDGAISTERFRRSRGHRLPQEAPALVSFSSGASTGVGDVAGVIGSSDVAQPAELARAVCSSQDCEEKETRAQFAWVIW